jgi:DTW domain-containing protein YfiP
VRDTCLRCLRPAAFCVCGDLRPIRSPTRVVLLQHPREARLAICSAWLTRLSLENAELHRGVRFEDHPRVAEVARAPGTALLYPGADATPAHAAPAPPRALVVIDATWRQSERMLRDNPTLAALPRLSVPQGTESGYAGLRREPAPDRLSTIEAVALALGALEHAPERYAPMVAAFRRAVSLQLGCARGPRRSPRHHAGRA